MEMLEGLSCILEILNISLSVTIVVSGLSSTLTTHCNKLQTISFSKLFGVIHTDFIAVSIKNYICSGRLVGYVVV
jgi:hypothetical protein